MTGIDGWKEGSGHRYDSQSRWQRSRRRRLQQSHDTYATTASTATDSYNCNSSGNPGTVARLQAVATVPSCGLPKNGVLRQCTPVYKN